MFFDGRVAYADPLTTDDLVGAFMSSLPKPGAGQTAFQRALGRNPRLAPSVSGDAAFRQWLADIGESPLEEDLPALYADMADLCGWPMADATATEIKLPIVMEKFAPLPAREAAIRFLESLRSSGQCRTYLAAELTALYTQHAHNIGRHETAINTLRKELAKLPGVVRSIRDDGHRSQKNQRRSRPTVWTIVALAPVAELEPEPEFVSYEPMRKAA